MRRGRSCIALLLTLLCLGCAGRGGNAALLPEEPLALVWRTEEEALRRKSFLGRARDRRTGARPQNHARVEEIGEYFGVGRSHEDRMADFQGRLALLDLRSGELSVASFALRGARPLDWSADHMRLLFQARIDGKPQIHEWDRSSDQVRPLTFGPHMHPTACYGPDGRIAFTEVSGTASSLSSRILLAGQGGAAPSPLSPGPRDVSPTWSSDGRFLVYGMDEAGQPAIAVLDLEAGGAPRVIARGRRPAFAPDGFVVYSASTRSGWKLFRMHPNGSGKRPLGTGPLEEHSPTVSADGRWVVYATEEDDRQKLRLRTLDGRLDRPLVISGDGLAPVWN